jgi:Na+/phosphate symporter
MLGFLLADANAPFAAALALMLLIGLFEGIGIVLGVGIGSVLDALIPDFNATPEIEVAEVGSNNALSRLLGWLKVGQVPILMLLIVFLVGFSGTGYFLNSAAAQIFSSPLPGIISVPIAFAAALPITRVGASALQVILPRDETSSVSLDSLIGRQAYITLGTATRTASAEARVQDAHGMTHYVMVQAEQNHGPFSTGEPLLLVRRIDNNFIAIKANEMALDT